MDKFTVKELQSRCKAAGLKIGGTKQELIDRLEHFSANTKEAEWKKRVDELEATVAKLMSRGGMNGDGDNTVIASSSVGAEFLPQAVSSPHHEPALQGDVPVTCSQQPVSVACSQQPVPVVTSVQQRPIVSWADLRMPAGNTLHMPVAQQAAMSTHEVGGPYAASNYVPSYGAAECAPGYIPVCSTNQYVPITSGHQTYETMDSDRHYITGLSAPPTSPNAFVPTYGYAGQIPMQTPMTFGQQPHLLYNVNQSFTNVKDIVAVLPDFNPTSDESITSLQFVQRVQVLKAAYGWRDDLLMFAVQQKLQGHAKMWMNSQCEVFTLWSQFAAKFTQAFPFDANSAGAHIKMANEQRKQSETPQNYYYRMMTLGARYGLPDNAIARHIINGINDVDLRKKISNDYFTCGALLKDIDAYCRYNSVRANYVKPFTKQESSTIDGKVTTNTQPHINRHIRCYNCAKYGHIASKCPEPRKKERPKPFIENRVNKVNTKQAAKSELLKTVIINGKTLVALVDPGSARTLIRTTAAVGLGNLSSCEVTLNGFGGGQYNCTKQIDVIVNFDEHELQIKCLLVDDELLQHDVLVGRDLLCYEGTRVVIQEDSCWMEKAENVASTTAHLQPDEISKLKLLINANRKCFAETIFELGTCSIAKLDIKLTSTVPVNKKPYRIEFAKRPQVEGMIQELLDANIIRESMSAYASPVVIVPKKNNELRLCVDYRMLNKITEKQPFPMPHIDEHLAKLSGNKFFTTMDLRMGYHQVEIEEHAKKFTAFVTINGHYEYNRMPFGLVNAPAVFQKIMNTIISQMDQDEILTYLDDVIIPSKTVNQGLIRLEKFLKILETAGLTLRLDKCKFLATNITYLGHEISENGIAPGSHKLAAVEKFPAPNCVSDVRRFLGLTGFFRKYIKDYAIITKPLTELLRKLEGAEFTWGEAQEKAFSTLKRCLCEKPVLALYNFHENHEVHTDASSLGLAGVILQSHDKKEWRPVFYYSRQCSEAERKYHGYELEVLAAVETLTKFRVYLLGKPFTLVTDCSALAKAKESKELLPKIARWYMRLMEFNFEAVHRPAERLAHVDALSRAPHEPSAEPETAGFVFNVTVADKDWLLTMQLQDKKLSEIISVLEGKTLSDQVAQLQTDYKLHNSRLYRKMDTLKFVVPQSARWRIVKLCHDDVGHFGLEKTLARIKQNFWFDRMRKYVQQYIAACTECCYNKVRGGMKEGELHITEVEPLPFITLHMDHLGPFTKSARGMCYVLAISDAFTKYLIVKPVRSTKTAPVITTLKEISSYFGLPRRIVTDRGTAFTSQMFQDYCDRNNIQHIKTAVRTPRANGQVERANQLILNSLRTLTVKPKDWDLKLTDIQWAVNSQVNSSSGFTPNELLFDFNMRDVIQNHVLAAVQDDQPEQDSKLPIDEKRQLAAERIKEEKARWKIRFDKKHKSPHKYAVGDLVVIAYEAPATGDSRKLEPKYRGPYQVSKLLSHDRYVVTDIRGMQITQRPFDSVFSSDKMKPWCDGCPILDADDEDDNSSLVDDSGSGAAELSDANI